MDGDDFATLVWQIEGFSSQSREKKYSVLSRTRDKIQ